MGCATSRHRETAPAHPREEPSAAARRSPRSARPAAAALGTRGMTRSTLARALHQTTGGVSCKHPAATERTGKASKPPAHSCAVLLVRIAEHFAQAPLLDRN